MRILPSFILTFAVLCLTYNHVVGFDSYQYLIEYRSPSYLKFGAGDVITCRIHSSFGSGFYGAEHVMLAINSHYVAHIEANGKDFNKGTLREQYFLSVTNEHGYTMCRIATRQYDQIMFAKGVVPRKSTTQMLDSAHYWISTQKVYYDFTGCNCQHWVTHWRYGKAWSVQSHQSPNNQCPLPNYFTSSPNALAGAYSKPLQAGARAEATVGEFSAGSGVFTSQGRGPSAGAFAEAGLHNTGAGFRASLGEVRGDIGRLVGGTLGLSADTGVSHGTDGTKIKLLGTGIEASRSKGFSLCLFGSCLHIG